MGSSVHAEAGSREQERLIKHYSNRQRIQLVGEGDFSFAACLARAFGSSPNIVATSLDSETQLRKKHSTAAANLVELKERGSTVIHEVNVSKMSKHPRLKHILFDRIVFNFPHAGFVLREHDAYQIELHQELVRIFLKNARKMLSAGGEMHITHKTAYPFSEWKIEELGNEVGMRLIEKARFYRSEYPGYVNKKGGDGRRSNKTFPVRKCSSYKFVN